MRIFLTGVSCVGKTTIGIKLAELLNVNFFDLDDEIESFFNMSIERLQSKFITIHTFRNEAAKALVHLLDQPESQDSVIALSPSGLMGGYLRVMKKTSGITAAITDKPENILRRIEFFDIDSVPLEKELTSAEKKLYLREIKKDITYFGKSYHRANLQIDISGLDQVQAALKIQKTVEEFGEKVKQKSRPAHAG